VCQKRARVTFRDRVPTEGSVVSMEPVFSHFMSTVLGRFFRIRLHIIMQLSFWIRHQDFGMLFRYVA